MLLHGRALPELPRRHGAVGVQIGGYGRGAIVATKDSSSASRHMKGGTRFDADELEAVVRVFELLVKWDDELQAKATASAPDKDMATSEPMKVVGGAE